MAGLTIGILFAQHAARASTGELYGYGSRASALGNTMLGGVDDAYTTYYNAAANSTHAGLHAALGVNWAHPSFVGINNVVVANNATTANRGDTLGNVDTDNYLDHLGQMVGASFNFGEQWKNLTAGVTAFMPLARIAYIDTGDPFKPEYVSYRSRTQRPQIYASMSASPMKYLHFAMGISIFTNLSATTTALVTGAPNSVSYQQFASTIKPGAAPYFSAYVNSGPLQLGGVIRMPAKAKVTIDTSASARILGPTNDLPLVVNSTSTIYYDPLEIDSAIGYQLTDSIWATAEADWLQYKSFEPPTLFVSDQGSGPKLNNSISTAPAMQNIITPKVGVEKKGDVLTLRGGYMYRPSPVTDNSGPGNLVDPARHSFTAGVGVNLKEAKVTTKDIMLNLHAQYHLLVQSHVTKSANNELGVAGQSKIGSPGYDIGGHIYGGGFSLSMSF